MVRRTKEEAQATRHRILDTAEELFQRDGVSRTSLNDIAQAAGLTRGAIYWHFTDKADLFHAMLMRVRLPLDGGADEGACAASDDPLGDMRHSFVEALKKTAGDPQVRRVFEIAMHKVEYVDDLAVVRELHAGFKKDCLAQAERGFRRAAALGLVRRGMSPRTAAIGMHALIGGLIKNWMLDTDAFDLVRVGRSVIDAYLAGLAAPAAPEA